MLALTNQRFNRLTALYPIKNRTKGGNIAWLCRCDCGSLVKVIGSELIRENTTSCGCLQKERSVEASWKHGDARVGGKTRLFSIWLNIKARCLNPNGTGYKYYGKKGISICQEWKNNYQNFKEWASAHGYADNLTIDRINHKGNYEPNNCQWITKSENVKKAHRDRVEIQRYNELKGKK